MGKTGKKCEQSGKYKCEIHSDAIIYLSINETFPPCKYGEGTTWIKVG